jgi:hypothetical protein
MLIFYKYFNVVSTVAKLGRYRVDALLVSHDQNKKLFESRSVIWLWFLKNLFVLTWNAQWLEFLIVVPCMRTFWREKTTWDISSKRHPKKPMARNLFKDDTVFKWASPSNGTVFASFQQFKALVLSLLSIKFKQIYGIIAGS